MSKSSNSHRKPLSCTGGFKCPSGWFGLVRIAAVLRLVSAVRKVVGLGCADREARVGHGDALQCGIACVEVVRREGARCAPGCRHGARRALGSARTPDGHEYGCVFSVGLGALIECRGVGRVSRRSGGHGLRLAVERTGAGRASAGQACAVRVVGCEDVAGVAPRDAGRSACSRRQGVGITARGFAGTVTR